MTNQTAAELVDFELLDEASRKLLGYYVHRKFNIYLSSIVAALNQQYQDGMSEGLTRPTPLGRQMLLDFRALDYNALIEVVGVCMYVLLCHTIANSRLRHRDDAKQVLCGATTSRRPSQPAAASRRVFRPGIPRVSRWICRRCWSGRSSRCSVRRRPIRRR